MPEGGASGAVGRTRCRRARGLHPVDDDSELLLGKVTRRRVALQCCAPTTAPHCPQLAEGYIFPHCIQMLVDTYQSRHALDAL
jgi:hypothetical protein